MHFKATVFLHHLPVSYYVQQDITADTTTTKMCQVKVKSIKMR